MELTFTDASLNDLGILDYTSCDFASGIDENDFDIVLADSSGVPAEGAFVYDESGGVGGVVRGYESERSTGLLHVIGDTWTGLLDRYVLVPSEGAYFSVSGDLNACIRALLSQIGAPSLFKASSSSSGVSVSHTFQGRHDATQRDTGRFMGGWAALWQLVSEHGCKCRLSWKPERRRIVVSGFRRADYTDAESLDAGVANVHVSRERPVNHLVCLGRGEGADRLVRHLYADRVGNVSESQSLKGLDELADVYDDGGADDEEKLISDGRKKLKELFAKSQTVRIGVGAEGASFELGDLIGGTDSKTGVSASAIVTKKVVECEGGATSITYESTVRS